MSTNINTVLITGASSGIGFGLAQAFLKKGSNVVLNARNSEKLSAEAKKLGNSSKIALVPGDIGIKETGEKLVKVAVERFGSANVLEMKRADAPNWVSVWAFAVLLSLYACAGPSGIAKKPAIPVGPQVQAPVYEDGDWWRVKVEVKRPPGVSSGVCNDCQYLIKMDAGEPKVYRRRFLLEGEQYVPIHGSRIVSNVLGKSKESLRFPLRVDIKFPMYVGLTWSSRHRMELPLLRGRWVDVDYQVQSWEKIRTPKGEFPAFKIVRSVTAGRGRVGTYYYSPGIKAIVHSREQSPPDGSGFVTTYTLTDFSVSD